MKFIKKGVDLSRCTTIRVGGAARFFATPADVDELVECVKFAQDMDIPIFILGGGSNTVFGNVNGLVVSMALLRNMKVMETEQGLSISAQAGVPLKDIVSLGVKKNLKGIYKLLGFPATVGGAVSMNAGAFGVEISEFIREVEFISWSCERVRVDAKELKFGYRSSPFPEAGIVSSVVFHIGKATEPVVEDYKTIRRKRKKSQPINMPTSGSTFKNPREGFAGELLERAGMKGYKVGDIAFSTVHANFMVNLGSARVDEVRKLISKAKERVYEEFGVRLEEEVRIVEDSGVDGWKIL